MYPVSRLVFSTLKASRQDTLAFDATGVMHFYCRPWDLDMFLEMNNGRILTLYDLGRFDLSIKTGLTKVLKQKKWGLAVAGSSVRYRKRVRLFDRVTMRTRLVGMDGRWFYMAQSMWVKGQPTSSVLLRTCITAKGRCLEIEKVMEAMGTGPQDWPHPMPEWVKNWADADASRPWPPDP